MLHELETGQSGRKSAGEFFLNQPGMLLLKEAWPEIDAKMKAKEKAITTACELSDDEWFYYFLNLKWNSVVIRFFEFNKYKHIQNSNSLEVLICFDEKWELNQHERCESNRKWVWLRNRAWVVWKTWTFWNIKILK